MSQELLYTSAPRGLKPGSRGFCTVLSSQGMPAPLAAAVEALSGYRPVYPPSDPRSSRNPVVYSHLKLQAVGRTWNILSRIADSGLDYSQRPNKLAHHVIIDQPGERLPGGPASLLGMPGFMRETWQGEPRVVPIKTINGTPPEPSGPCEFWQAVTGDAGWAGVLAESFLRDPDRMVILLFKPGQTILPLFAEAISLIPPSQRWNVTFSTYFTALATGTTCNWRAMIHDSKEAHESLRFVQALRIDLTNGHHKPATGGTLVEAARNDRAEIVGMNAPRSTPRIGTAEIFNNRSQAILPAVAIEEHAQNENAVLRTTPPSLLTTNTKPRLSSPDRARYSLQLAYIGATLPLCLFLGYLLWTRFTATTTHSNVSVSEDSDLQEEDNKKASPHKSASTRIASGNDPVRRHSPIISNLAPDASALSKSTEGSHNQATIRVETTAQLQPVLRQGVSLPSRRRACCSGWDALEPNQKLDLGSYPLDAQLELRFFRPRWLQLVADNSESGLSISDNSGTTANRLATISVSKTSTQNVKLKKHQVNGDWLGWGLVLVQSGNGDELVTDEFQLSEMPIKIRAEDRVLIPDAQVVWRLPNRLPIESARSRVPALILESLSLFVDKGTDPTEIVIPCLNKSPDTRWELPCNELTAYLVRSIGIDPIPEYAPQIKIEFSFDSTKVTSESEIVISISGFEGLPALITRAAQSWLLKKTKELSPDLFKQIELPIQAAFADEIKLQDVRKIIESRRAGARSGAANEKDIEKKTSLETELTTLDEINAAVDVIPKCHGIKPRLEGLRLCRTRIYYVVEDSTKSKADRKPPIQIDVVSFGPELEASEQLEGAK